MSRESHLRTLYGITTEQYEELLNRQNRCCAICKRHEDEFKIRLCVDHDHISGEIRGALCTNCNRYMVGRHRDSDILRRIADYVGQGTGWYVPRRNPKRRRKKKIE